MDDGQTNHLKAYGLTYNAIKAGMQAEWLLNYRGGAFLLPDAPELRRRAGLDGITLEPVDDAQLAAIRARDRRRATWRAVPLEKAPKIAVYTPPDAQPWDDAVTLALKYAGIEYTPIYDDEVEQRRPVEVRLAAPAPRGLHGPVQQVLPRLSRRAVVHRARRRRTRRRRSGSASPTCRRSRRTSPRRSAQFVERGGFLFAMCGATETLELAIAGHERRHRRQSFADGTPMDPDADAKMDWKRSFAFKDAHLEQSPFVNSMSDIDGHQVNVPGRRQPLGTFTLFNFSAKFDPVPSMLVQDHRAVVNDFYGVTTSFTRRRSSRASSCSRTRRARRG